MAAEALGCSRAEASEVRAAGFLHDVGRVAVPNGIWDKPRPLSASEQERVRLHAYYVEAAIAASVIIHAVNARRRLGRGGRFVLIAAW